MEAFSVFVFLFFNIKMIKNVLYLFCYDRGLQTKDVLQMIKQDPSLPGYCLKAVLSKIVQLNCSFLSLFLSILLVRCSSSGTSLTAIDLFLV